MTRRGLEEICERRDNYAGLWRFATVPLMASALATGAPAQVPEYELTPEVRIGSVDDPATALSRVPMLAVAPDGRLAIPQPRSMTVLLFSTDGQRLGEVGGPGEGPGEFRHVSVIGWRADTLWVIDERLKRISFFHPDVEEPRIRSAVGTPYAERRVLFPLRMAEDRWLSARQLAPEGERTTAGRAFFLIDEGWSNAHPLVRIAEWPQRIRVEFGDATQVLSDYQPFSDRPLLTISPRGEHVTVVRRSLSKRSGSTGRYTVTRMDMLGDTLFHVVREVTLNRVAPDTRQAVVEHYASHPGVQSIMPSVAAAHAALEDALFWPSYHPAVSSVIVGTSGRTWLRGQDDWSETVRWNVLDAQGRLERVVKSDRELKIEAATPEAVWAVTRDELDVPYVIRYDFRPASDPSRP